VLQGLPIEQIGDPARYESIHYQCDAEGRELAGNLRRHESLLSVAVNGVLVTW
jgi:hypothetical protein